MNELQRLVQIGGWLQLAIVVAGLAVPLVLDWWKLLAPLTGFMRRLVWVYGGFIAFVNGAFGLLGVVHAEFLVSGAPVARLLCAIMATYWLARLLVQLFVFDVRPLGLGRVTRVGYHSLTAAFVYLPVVYGLAAMPKH